LAPVNVKESVLLFITRDGKKERKKERKKRGKIKKERKKEGEATTKARQPRMEERNCKGGKREGRKEGRKHESRKENVARRGLYSTAALYIADCALAPNDVVSSFISRGATTPSGAGAPY
jgi:hypothetical protein